MNQILRLGGLCLVLLTSHFAFSQDSYYWSHEQRLLIEDRSTISIHFVPGTTVERVKQLSHSLLTELELSDIGYAERAVLIFSDLIQVELPELQEALGISAQELRSISWGYHDTDGLRMWLSHQILYKPNSQIDPAAFETILAEYPSTKQHISHSGVEMLELENIQDVLPLANSLYESGMFEYCHPNFTAKAYLNSDPYFGEQYYLHNTGQFVNGPSVANYDIDALQAWTLNLGSSNITVAVIDDGVEDHIDLEDGLGVSRVLPGFTPHLGTFTGVPLDPTDGHGQCVSGIIAASHNNMSVRGIVPEVKILPICVRLNYTTPIIDFVDALNHAYQNGADVLNNSWAYNTCGNNVFPSMTTAINDAKTLGRGGLGCPVLFAAGHDGMSCVAYPSNMMTVLAIGAVSQTGLKPPYVNYGPMLDLAGVSSPGSSNIRTIDRMGINGYNNGGGSDLADVNSTRFFGGTSTSTGEASGVAAMLLSENGAITADSVYTLMIQGAVDLGTPGFDNNFGWGRLSAYGSMLWLVNNGLPVEYLNLEGISQDRQVLLKWATARETDSKAFIIEKFQDEIFVEIGSVASKGDSESPQHYEFADLQPIEGLNIYRLRQVDINGESHLSNLVETLFSFGAEIFMSHVYPNPADQDFVFLVKGESNIPYKYQLMDTQGRMLLQDQLIGNGGESKVTLNARELPNGLYVLKLTTPQGKSVIRKVLVQHN